MFRAIFLISLLLFALPAWGEDLYCALLIAPCSDDGSVQVPEFEENGERNPCYDDAAARCPNTASEPTVECENNQEALFEALDNAYEIIKKQSELIKKLQKKSRRSRKGQRGRR